MVGKRRGEGGRECAVISEKRCGRDEEERRTLLVEGELFILRKSIIIKNYSLREVAYDGSIIFEKRMIISNSY